MTATKAAFDIIKKAEDGAGFRSGCCSRLMPYLCPAGLLTIGWGHTGRDVTAGMQITPERADQLLEGDVAAAGRIVEKAVTLPLSQCQYDALVSFVLNVGPGAAGGERRLRPPQEWPAEHDAAKAECRRLRRSGGRAPQVEQMRR